MSMEEECGKDTPCHCRVLVKCGRRYGGVVLPEGKEKLMIEEDPAMRNTINFTLEAEDHTLGNLLRMQLLEDPNVQFAGYKVPHPLEHRILVKVQAREGLSSTDALASMSKACDSLKREIGVIRNSFITSARTLEANVGRMEDIY